MSDPHTSPLPLPMCHVVKVNRSTDIYNAQGQFINIKKVNTMKVKHKKKFIQDVFPSAHIGFVYGPSGATYRLVDVNEVPLMTQEFRTEDEAWSRFYGVLVFRLKKKIS